ncbi:MAG: hypothetical protein NTY19_03910 [Planctomycetota bacterium]|nr:hypothetical protein [Planctomycetota bacterium]
MSAPSRRRLTGAPVFSRRHIVETAERLSRQYALLVEPELALMAVSFDAVYEQVIYPDFGIVLVEDEDLGFDDEGKKILGQYDPWENTAFIDMSLQPTTRDPRRTFTCWHEVGGHGILQGDWLRQQLGRNRDDARVVTTEDSIDFATTIALERQANLFASYAGAPTWFLNHAIRETYRGTRPIRYIGPRKYCLDVRGHCQQYDVEDFNDLCRVIALNIQWKFGGMSIEALSYRIESSPFVVDVTRPSFRLQRTAKTKGPRFPQTTARGMAMAVARAAS